MIKIVIWSLAALLAVVGIAVSVKMIKSNKKSSGEGPPDDIYPLW